ncbi:phosphatase PAP2 family protein [Phreatobacter stygius]|uniref:phosphatase PAP2 family protein n=1 Tax=Phreatobacter stygius TaxID=1940610 RepID=UPI001476D78D|nr:phosphatase PAP2 family protein [Phreatobacter stygius]
MYRKALFVVVLALSVASLVLAVFPQLDLAVSRLFWTADGGFWMSRYPVLNGLRQVSMIPTIGLGVVSLIALVVKIAWPGSKPILPARMAVFFVASMLASTIVLVNVVLKEHWARARPVHVTEFGGRWTFQPWWQPGDGTGCRTNCSFISGEASGAAWLVAPALVAPPAVRPAALVAVGVYTVAISALRMAYGGHFLSDVLIAILATLLIVIGFHYWIYQRWGWPDDDVVADRLGAIGRSIRGLFSRKS